MTAIPKPSKFDRPIRAAYTGLKHPKSVRVADSRYRKHVNSLGCQVKHHSPKLHPHCERTAGTDYTRRVVIYFAHTATNGIGKGMGRKASDLGGGIGLCARLGEEQEAIGWDTFQRKYQIDAVAIARELGEAWTKKQASRGAR